MKKILATACGLFISVVLCLTAACSGTEVNGRIEKVDADASIETVNIDLTERARYTNPITDEQMPNRADSPELTGLENMSLSGDPYFLRYDGKFYVYVSTDEWISEYRCWETTDFMTYKFMGVGKLLDAEGNANNPDFQCAYAPEVHYWNGDFYMYFSPHATKHYVFKSVNGTPWGDYQMVNDTFGQSGVTIDGTVFIDDDESMYFVYPSRSVDREAKVAVMPMSDMEHTPSGSDYTLITDCGITGGWEEGPFMIKRDGIYYLINTGEDVGKPSYRINYAYNTSALSEDDGIGEVASPDEWKTEEDPVLVLETDGDYIGSGHGCLTIGPDLDSWYLPYHVSRATNTRRTMAFNRVEFSGGHMTLMGDFGTEMQIPAAPDFYVDGNGNSYTEERTQEKEGLYKSSDGKQILSSKNTGDMFTAEYNFKGIEPDGTFKCLFGGGYVTINGKNIELYKGNEKIATGTLKNDFDWDDAVHSVTVVYKEGRISVRFDSLTKIDVQASGFGNGAIGYEGMTESTYIGATVFSNQAFGSSDNDEAKIVNGSFFAANYYVAKEGESASVISSGSKTYMVEKVQGADDFNIYSEAEALRLAEGDRAVYKIDVPETGLYAIESLFSNDSDGSIIKIQIDDKTPTCYELKKLDYSANSGEVNMTAFDYSKLEFQKRMIDEIELEKGLHTFTVKAVQGNYTAVEYNIIRTHTNSPQYSDDLSKMYNNNYYLDWTIKDGAHYANEGYRSLAEFGDRTLTDYTVKVEVKSETAIAQGKGRAGLIVRMSEPTIYLQASDGIRLDYGSAYGYFVYMDRLGVCLEKIGYNHRSVAYVDMTIDAAAYHEFEVSCIGNTISVSFDGEHLFSFTDPYVIGRGSIGLYSCDSDAYFKNLEVSPA